MFFFFFFQLTIDIHHHGETRLTSHNMSPRRQRDRAKVSQSSGVGVMEIEFTNLLRANVSLSISILMNRFLMLFFTLRNEKTNYFVRFFVHFFKFSIFHIFCSMFDSLFNDTGHIYWANKFNSFSWWWRRASQNIRNVLTRGWLRASEGVRHWLSDKQLTINSFKFSCHRTSNFCLFSAVALLPPLLTNTQRWSSVCFCHLKNRYFSLFAMCQFWFIHSLTRSLSIWHIARMKLPATQGDRWEEERLASILVLPFARSLLKRDFF